MDFIDEEHVAGVERGQQARQVARLVEHGTGGDFHVHPHFVRDDMGEGRLSQAGRTVEKRMVQRFPAFFRSLDINAEIGDDFPLSGKIFQDLRPDNSV